MRPRRTHGFIDFLRQSNGTVTLQSSKGGFNEIDLRLVDTFVPLTISLEQLASEMMCWRELVETKTIPNTAKPVVATCIWDFETITEVLDDPSILLHYLTRRYLFEQRALYTGDELDLLVLYLDTALEIPKAAVDSPLLITHLSAQLHQYFIGREHRLLIEKPCRQLTTWWRSLVAAIWRKQTVESREASFALLDVPIEQQRKDRI